jgi:hypothetical protein
MGGVNSGPSDPRRHLERFGVNLRSEIDQVLLLDALLLEGRRLGRKRLRGACLLAWHGGLFHGLLDDRPNRLDLFTIKHV